MATIRTAIQLYDGLTPVARGMSKALNMTLSSFEAMQRAMNTPMDNSALESARRELNQVEIAFDSIEKQIKEATGEQDKFARGGAGVGSMLTKLAAGAAAAFSVSRIIQMSDQMTSTKARLDLINDGLQTTDKLQTMIAASANDARADYVDTAAAIGKMGVLAGNAFQSTKEIVAFTELMNKNFVIGGASIMEQSAAMYQLTQAMAAGRLQGDEFRSIMENAPLLAKSIADYMGMSVGKLREMSREGKITSDVIKNALFASAEETEKRFAAMPMTFAQVTTIIKNTLLRQFEPALQVIGKGAKFIYDNWSTLEPMFYGLASAIAVYTAVTGAQTIATWLAVAANRALFMTMMANPVMWIAAGIGLLVAVIYKWVQAVGGADVAWKMFTNGLLYNFDRMKIGLVATGYWFQSFWDAVTLGALTGVTAVNNYMGDLRSNTLMNLQNMANGSLDIINKFIAALNKIPGVNIQAIEGVTFGSTAQMENQVSKDARNQTLSDYRSKVESAVAERDANIQNMWSDANVSKLAREAEIQRMKAEGSGSGYDLTDIINNLQNTADNTGKIADSMDITEENLKYLRDLAEQEVVNRFTTAEIKIEMTNNNQINSDADIDGIVRTLEERLYETMETAAEGVPK